MYLFNRYLLSIVDASHKEKNGSSSETDEQAREIAEREIMHARYWFV